MALAVYLGLLSNLPPRMNVLWSLFQDCSRFSSICLPNNFSYPAPTKEKHAHSMELKSPCFSLRMAYPGGCAVLDYCHTLEFSCCQFSFHLTRFLHELCQSANRVSFLFSSRADVPNLWSLENAGGLHDFVSAYVTKIILHYIYIIVHL